MMIVDKFGYILSQKFRGDDFCKRLLKGVNPIKIDFGLKFQVHLTKDFEHF